MSHVISIEHLILPKSALRATLLPRLLNTVFHVTSDSAFAGIQAHGAIHSNRDGTLGATFPQSVGGFGRARGYVCMFDLRTASSDQIDHALDAMYFLDPFAGAQRDPVFLFLRPAEYTHLIAWESARESHEMFVWYVESWYPGDVPLHAISSALAVTIERPPDGPHLAALRAASHRS